ncbi:MAG: alpha/beta hydrolase [Candidatus Methylomirabilales bacterium]
MMRPKSLALALSLILSTAMPAWADEVITISPGRAPLFGVSGPVAQSYILIEVENPIACLVLSPGGRGTLFVADRQLSINSTNFLVRSRHLFAAERFCVAVLDAATDFLFRPGGDGLRGLRRSSERIADIEAVIQDLRTRFGVPVWVVGTSRGTIDVAAVAAQLGPPVGPDGLVLTSTITRPSVVFQDNVLDDVDLGQVQVPTLLVFHKDDACFTTPPEDVKDLKQRLVTSPKVRVLNFNGGSEPLSGPCQALSPHGFFGIEPKVVRDIAKRIEKLIEDTEP